MTTNQNENVTNALKILPELLDAWKASDYTGLGNTHYWMPLDEHLAIIVRALQAIEAV